MDQEHQRNKPEKTEFNERGLRHEGTVLNNKHIRENIPTLYNPWTKDIYTQPPPYNYTWQQQTLHLKVADSTSDNSRLPEDMPRFCIQVLFEECSGATSGEVFSSLNNSDSRPSNSLFQIARGSGATLSECTFSPKKRTSPRRLLQDRSLQDIKTKRTRI